MTPLSESAVPPTGATPFVQVFLHCLTARSGQGLLIQCALIGRVEPTRDPRRPRYEVIQVGERKTFRAIATELYRSDGTPYTVEELDLLAEAARAGRKEGT